MRFPKAMLWLIAVFTGIFGNAAYGSDCRDVEFEAKSFTVCTVQASEDLRLFLGGPDGPYASFWSLDRALQKQGQKLGFAMNAGMFHRDLSPVGLYVEHGAQKARIITSDGPGNFGLLPNGVFCIAEDDFAVVETLRFQATQRKCNYATQSGPMLVIDGVLHQKFIATSDSLNIRNGVGVRDDGQTALFVISNDRVNFHEFARFFKDALMAQSALYLDGSISRLYAPMIARHDGGFPMGPIVGTVVPQD